MSDSSVNNPIDPIVVSSDSSSDSSSFSDYLDLLEDFLNPAPREVVIGLPAFGPSQPVVVRTPIRNPGPSGYIPRHSSEGSSDSSNSPIPVQPDENDLAVQTALASLAAVVAKYSPLLDPKRGSTQYHTEHTTEGSPDQVGSSGKKQKILKKLVVQKKGEVGGTSSKVISTPGEKVASNKEDSTDEEESS